MSICRQCNSALRSLGPVLSRPTSVGILLVRQNISQLEFTCRYIYLGLFDSEVEAARYHCSFHGSFSKDMLVLSASLTLLTFNACCNLVGLMTGQPFASMGGKLLLTLSLAPTIQEIIACLTPKLRVLQSASSSDIFFI